MCHLLKKASTLKCDRQTDGHTDDKEVIPIYQPAYADDAITMLKTVSKEINICSRHAPSKSYQYLHWPLDRPKMLFYPGVKKLDLLKQSWNNGEWKNWT